MITRYEMKKIRKELGLTQHDFAKGIGLQSPTQVSCYERDVYTMTKEISESVLKLKKNFKELKNLFKSGQVSLEEISRKLDKIYNGKNIYAYISKGKNNFPVIRFDFKANSEIKLKNKSKVCFLN